MADYADPPTFGVATVTVPQLNRLSENIRYLKEQLDALQPAAVRVLHAQTNLAGVGNVGSGITDLMSYTLPAGLLARDGDMVEVVGMGSKPGANSKTLRFVFGATSQFLTGSSDTTDWVERVRIVRMGAAVQWISYREGIVDVWGAAETCSNAITLKMTGQATVNDEIKQHIMTVRYLPAPV